MISRRGFVQSMFAVGTASALPTGVAADGLPTEQPVAAGISILTPDEERSLTAVLNRLIPANGTMPGAGDLGVAAFMDDALAKSPDSRRHIIGILSELQVRGDFISLSDADADALLAALEQGRKESFQVLLQTAYTGYYTHPTVLAVLG